MSVFEIALLAITVLAGFSIVWSTFIVGISPMPSSKKAREAMMQLSNEIVIDTSIEREGGPIFELGSGWGSLLIPLAKMHPRRKIVGYELSIMPWLTSVMFIKVLGLKNVKVYRQNFLNADLSGASVIFCYLFPAGMNTLEKKLNTENEKPEYLISNNFSLSTRQPIKVIQLTDLYKSPVYLYKLK